MRYMINKSKPDFYSILSLAISLLSIAVTVFINIKIAHAFIMATGKTKALFGLVSELRFGYKYYVLIPSIVSLIAALLSIIKNSGMVVNILAVALSVISILIVFLNIWRLML